MENEAGYGKPPVETRFQKGRSGNPGGVPGPARLAEKRLQKALKAAIEAGPEAFLDWKTASAIELLAQTLVESAASGDKDALRQIYGVLPEPGRRAHVSERLRRWLDFAERRDAFRYG